MIAFICSGGPSEELCPFERFLNEKEIVFIGVDRGAYHLMKSGIVPDAIVGDFDSVSEEEWREISAAVNHVESYQAEKDETDTDLALIKALTYNPKKIVLTGVTGGRLDHYEAVMRTVCRLQQQHPTIQFEIMNNQNRIQFLQPGTHYLEQDPNYPYVSFFAYGHHVHAVTLRGMKYETTNETMDLWTSRFTSNEIIEKAHITFESGICLMIRSAD